MDERRAVEVLRTVRSVFDNIPAPCEEREALDHAIATIERVAVSPVAYVSVVGMADGDDLLTLEPRDRQDREAIRQLRTNVRLVPDPQPDGQEG